MTADTPPDGLITSVALVRVWREEPCGCFRARISALDTSSASRWEAATASREELLSLLGRWVEEVSGTGS